MPAVIPWGVDELQTLASNPTSRVFCEQKKIPVVLQPFHLQDLKSAVRDLLNASVNSYDRSLDGILLSYKHLKVLSKSASVAAETSGVVLEIQADFYVFRPEIGGILQGVVNKKSNDHVGVLLYHRYNVSCPRPRSDERSAKWFGNRVAMHQEVTIKLKERNFSGKLPFFKGKIVDVGKVLSKSVAEAESKSKKKKSKEAIAEPLSLPETPDALSSSVSKKSKRKLDNTSDDKSYAKKSKKDREGSLCEPSKAPTVHSTLSSEPVESISSKKKKKRVSIGVADEMDFIPRLSLDVSQLPENLPPPNADSTHFDLAKLHPSKSEKKRRKENPGGLSSVKEESVDTASISSKIQNHLHTSSKSSQINEEKSKKKKKDKKPYSESNLSKDNPMLSHGGIDVKISDKMILHSTHSLTSSFKTVSEGRESLHESLKKKKVPELPSLDQKRKQIEIQSKKSVTELPQDFAKSKKQKHQEPASQVEALSPNKGKKSKKDKILNVLSQVNVGLQDSQGSSGKDSAVGQVSSMTELVSFSKDKKKTKEEGRNISPSKHSRKKKGQEIQDENGSSSDDTIPPGQRIVRESPLKLSAIYTPQKRENLSSVSVGKSPGMGYIHSSSMTDYDLGVKKGARPVIFGNLEGRILPPPESPLKSPKKTLKMQDSDSDTPQPKKVILSSSVQKQSSDSESDSGNMKYPVSSSLTKSNHASKQSEDSSDSEYNAAVKNKFLQSMGVMQSPLKPAKHNAKQDTSDSESESSNDEKEKNHRFSVLQKVLSSSRENGAQVKRKSKIVDKIKSSPTKQSNFKSKVSQKTNDSQSTKAVVLSATVPEDSDSDMEIMKTALQQLEQEKLSGKPSKQRNKRVQPVAAKTQEGPKKTASTVIKTAATPKKTIQTSKEKLLSKNITNVSNDSDSGPDDRNTTALMLQMREERAAEEKIKKSKQSGKQPKALKEPAIATVAKSQKPKGTSKDVKKVLFDPKAAKSTKNTGKKGPVEIKKQKTKSSKKESSDELSDVIQRLMQQAKLNVGLK